MIHIVEAYGYDRRMFSRLICTALCILTYSIQAAEHEWMDLFNGRDLSGWTVKCLPRDKDKCYWAVVDGAIMVNSMQDPDHDYVWLQSDGEYTDFELRLKFQIYKDSPGNSGVQIRSRYDDEAGWLDGPQLDIHPPNPLRTGLIYDETRGTTRWINPSLEPGNHNILPAMANPNIKLMYGDEGWNEMQIIAVGTRIKCIINGKIASDYEGKGVLDDAGHLKYNVGMKGHIALQLHNSDELKARFKDIRIREI